MNKYIINVISKVLLLFVLFNIPIIYAAEPTPAVPPGGISDLTALSGNNEGEVILIWTAPGDDGDDPLGTVSGYSVRYAEVQINDITDFNDFSVKNVKIYSHNWTDFVNGGQVETRTLVSLTNYNGRRLYFALRASDEVPNSGTWSTLDGTININNSCLVKLIPPSPVNNLSISAGYKTITVNWTSPGDDGDVGDITNGAFEIRCSLSGNITSESEWDTASSGYPYRILVTSSMIAGSNQSYTLTGLFLGSTYYFAIKIRDENENGWSDIDITSPKASSIPVNISPTVFGLSSPANNSILTTAKPTFDWEESTDPDNAGIHSYGLQISESSDFLSFVQSPIGILYSSYTLIEALPDDKTYYWRAKAIDIDEGITYSNGSRIIHINTSNSPPASFNLVSPNNENVLKRPKLTWYASSDPDPPWTIKYTVYYSSYSNFSSYQTISNLTDTSYTFTTNLTESLTYYWKVAVTDDYIVPASVFSTETNSFYVKPVLPSAPANIKLTDNSISWDSVLLDEDGASIKDFLKYKIYRSTDVKNIGTITTFVGYTTLTSTISVSGYWTTIRAIDEFGNESANSVSVNPDETKQILVSNGRDLLIEIPQTAQNLLENKIISITKTGNIYEIKTIHSSNLSDVGNFEFTSPVKITFETNDDCIYWYNGIEYVALGGRIGNSITIQTKKLGKFYTGNIQTSKLKLISAFPSKIFTPNNDGINDEMNLIFAGISDESIDAEIFDMSGRKVADMTQKDFSWFIWDGKDAAGKVVLPGVYIYQLKNGKYVLNGTIIVAR